MEQFTVQNMTSSKGNKIANQFIINFKNGMEVFQSYDSTIAIKYNMGGNDIILDKNYWDYSTTTGKYRNIFLDETKKVTERKIKTGEYLLDDLN